MVTLPADERGQLLLIGAVAVAIVVVGGVVLLNGMKYTDTVGTSGTDKAIDDSERTVEMLEDDLEGLVKRVGNDTSLVTFGDHLQENVSMLNRHYTTMVADQRSAYVNISINESASGGGWLLNQTETGQFENESSGREKTEEWTIIKDANVTDPFQITVDAWPESNKNQDNAFYVNVTDSTGQWWSLKLNDSGGSANQTKQLSVYTDKGLQESYTEGNTASSWLQHESFVINVTEGQVNTTDSTLWEFDGHVSSPYSVSFRDKFSGSGSGDGEKSAKGRYMIATDGTASDQIPDDVNQTELGVLHPAFDIYYHQPEVQYTRTLSVEYQPAGADE